MSRVAYSVASALVACVSVAGAQTALIHKEFGTIGDSELHGTGTFWNWSKAGIDPVQDSDWNERRGHSLIDVLVYMSGTRFRSRVNTAWGGTTTRDWATDGKLQDRRETTANSKNADKSRVYRWNPGFALYCLGMNDAVCVPRMMLSLPEHQAYFEQIIRSLRQHNVSPLVLLDPPRDDVNATSVRSIDGLTVAGALTQMVASDKAYCEAHHVRYVDTRSLFSQPDNPSVWNPIYRLDGVHWHAPKALKLLASTILQRSDVQQILQAPVEVAKHAPSNGYEPGNLLRFACFQGSMIPRIGPSGWKLMTDPLDEDASIVVEPPPIGSPCIGSVLKLTRFRGDQYPTVVSQAFSTGFAPLDEVRISGFFRATNFGDMFHDGGDLTPETYPRCDYSIRVRFLKPSGADLAGGQFVSVCDAWSIDTDSQWWRFYSDFVVPAGTASMQVELVNEGTPGLENQSAAFEVGNLLLKVLGPSGNGIVYP